MKKCSNCSETKPLTDFYRKLNGYQNRCKPCNSEISMAYQARARRIGHRPVRDISSRLDARIKAERLNPVASDIAFAE